MASGKDIMAGANLLLAKIDEENINPDEGDGLIVFRVHQNRSEKKVHITQAVWLNLNKPQYEAVLKHVIEVADRLNEKILNYEGGDDDSDN